MMDCEQLRNQIDKLTLTPCDLPVESEVLRHLEGCDDCRIEFREQTDAWLLFAAALPQSPVSEELEQRVMNRVANAPSPRPEYSTKQVFWKYAVAATVLFLLVGGTILRLSDDRQPQVTDSDMERIRSIASSVERLDELERVFAKSQLKYVSLKTDPDEPVCFLIQDQMSKQVHFLASGILAKPGVSPRLWLLTDDGRIESSSAIDYRADEKVAAAVFHAQLGQVRKLLITEEKSDEAPEVPSENVILRCDLEFQ